MMRALILIAGGAVLALIAGSAGAQAVPAAAASPLSSTETVRLWPGQAPGTESWSGPETDNPVRVPGATLHMVSNVTVPTLTVYRPAAGHASGAAMIVVPGGGFQNLAVTHEGDLVAKWLADRGVTAFILKYRVRTTPNFRLPTNARHDPAALDRLEAQLEPGRLLAVADATRAMRYLRANAARYGIAPQRIGMIGFSAGAITTMSLVQGPAADRPDLAAPIYGWMAKAPVPKDAPPLFVAAAQDDPLVPAVRSTAIFDAWTAADRPAELHVYERGGHGFGLFAHHLPVDAWPQALEAWLALHGWLTAAKPAG